LGRAPEQLSHGIILLVIIVAALFLSSPSPQPITIPAPAIISSTDFVAPTAPQPPSCTIAINGQKVPPSSIHLQVMANTCIPGDVTELRVSVNGQQKGMLGTSPGCERDVCRHVRHQFCYGGGEVWKWGGECCV